VRGVPFRPSDRNPYRLDRNPYKALLETIPSQERMIRECDASSQQARAVLQGYGYIAPFFWILLVGTPHIMLSSRACEFDRGSDGVSEPNVALLSAVPNRTMEDQSNY